MKIPGAGADVLSALPRPAVVHKPAADGSESVHFADQRIEAEIGGGNFAERGGGHFGGDDERGRRSEHDGVEELARAADDELAYARDGGCLRDPLHLAEHPEKGGRAEESEDIQYAQQVVEFIRVQWKVREGLILIEGYSITCTRTFIYENFSFFNSLSSSIRVLFSYTFMTYNAFI